MKKFIVCFALVFALLFSGCSCTKKQKLSFATNWLNNLEYTRDYKVELSDYNDGTYKYEYKDSDKYGEIKIEGDFLISIKTANMDSIKGLVDEEFKSQLKEGLLYKVETNLNLSVNYSKYSTTPYNDYTLTEAYFFGQNLFPIYAKTTSHTTYLNFNDDKLNITELDIEDETVYSSESYSVNRIACSSDKEKITSTKQYNYEQGTVIDNSYLLFALENYIIADKDASKSISVVSTTYGESKDLTVKYFEDEGATKLESFILQDSNAGCFGGNVGKAQVIQLENVSDNERRIIKYASPLSSNDNDHACFGALVFTLNK